MTHANWTTAASRRRNIVFWTAGLLVTLGVCQVDSACLQESQVSDRYGKGSTFEKCKEGSESDLGRFNCTYRVVKYENFRHSNSFEADEMSHENASFELNLAVNANETVIIGLIRDSENGEFTFRKIFIACMKLKVDGRWKRLRVNLRLSEKQVEDNDLTPFTLYSYSMYTTKTTNGKLCEQPTMRLFLPVRLSDNGRPSRTSLQLAVRNSSCISTGENCTIDAYLRRNPHADVEKLTLRTKWGGNHHVCLIAMRSSRWNHGTIHGVTFHTDASRVDEILQWLSDEESDSTARWTIYDNKGVKGIEKLATLTQDLNCTKQPDKEEESQLERSLVGLESAGKSPTVWQVMMYISCSFSLLVMLCPIMWRCQRVLKAWKQRATCDNQGCILFVLAGGVNRHSTAVTCFRRALVLQQATLSLAEVPDGLSGLNPQLVRGCRLLLFVSADAKFTDFRLGDCRSEQTRWALMTAMTERNRIWGCYLSNCDGARPPRDSPWAKMPTVGIGMKKCEEGAVMDGRRHEEIANAAARRLVVECGLRDELA